MNRVSDACLWVDVAALIADSDQVRVALVQLGKERMDSLDQALIPLIKTVSADKSGIL